MRFKDNKGNIYFIDTSYDQMKTIVVKPAGQTLSRNWKSHQNKRFNTELAAVCYLQGVALRNKWQKLRD